jgi:hypothetical protein
MKLPPDRNPAYAGTIYPGHIHPLRPVFRNGVAKAFVGGETERVRDYVLADFGDANQDPDERHVLRSIVDSVHLDSIGLICHSPST